MGSLTDNMHNSFDYANCSFWVIPTGKLIELSRIIVISEAFLHRYICHLEEQKT